MSTGDGGSDKIQPVKHVENQSANIDKIHHEQRGDKHVAKSTDHTKGHLEALAAAHQTFHDHFHSAHPAARQMFLESCKDDPATLALLEHMSGKNLPKILEA